MYANIRKILPLASSHTTFPGIGSGDYSDFIWQPKTTNNPAVMDIRYWFSSLKLVVWSLRANVAMAGPANASWLEAILSQCRARQNNLKV